MNARSLLAPTLLLTTLALPAAAQSERLKDVVIETVRVADGVHMLTGRGGNIGVASGKDGVFLIDDQFAPLSEKILAAVRAIDPAPPRFLLNTHWHGDHTGGNEKLGKAGVLILAHEQVRARLAVDQLTLGSGREIKASPPEALPVVTFNDQLTFHLNGDEIHVFHVAAAHTDGDSVVHFRKANVIHTGDTYFNGGFPFIDTASGGSVEGVLRAVERILALADEQTKIIPGHGALSNKAELLAYQTMLSTSRDRVRAAIGAGKTIQQLLAEGPVDDYAPTWGQGFVNAERFVQILYADLSTP